MKAFLVCSVLLAVAINVLGSAIPQQDSEEYYPQVIENVPEHHGRSKRSPLDPVVAPLLIGKSFLYGALLGPKLFKPVYIYHHKPHYHHGYGHGHGWGWGWGK